MKKIVSFLCITAMLFISCDRTSVIDPGETTNAKLSGKDIFKTIFFSLGENAQNISSFEKQVAILNEKAIENPSFLKTYESKVDAYLADIDARNPDYFNQLKNAVYSENFSRIKKELEYGTTLLAPIITLGVLNKIDDQGLKEKLINLNISKVDFKNQNDLYTLNQQLFDIIKHSNYLKQDDVKNAGLCLEFDVAIQFELAYQFNLALHYDLAYKYNLAYENEIAWKHDWAWELTDDTLQKEYDNFAGEKLIKEIAFAF